MINFEENNKKNSVKDYTIQINRNGIIGRYMHDVIRTLILSHDEFCHRQNIQFDYYRERDWFSKFESHFLSRLSSKAEICRQQMFLQKHSRTRTSSNYIISNRKLALPHLSTNNTIDRLLCKKGSMGKLSPLEFELVVNQPLT